MGEDESLLAIVSDDAKLCDLRLAAFEDRVELTAEQAPVVGMDVSKERLETGFGSMVVPEDLIQLR